MDPKTRIELPDGVTLLAEPLGWECDTCHGRTTIPEPTMPLEYLADMLNDSAAQHLRSHT